MRLAPHTAKDLVLVPIWLVVVDCVLSVLYVAQVRTSAMLLAVVTAAAIAAAAPNFDWFERLTDLEAKHKQQDKRLMHLEAYAMRSHSNSTLLYTRSPFRKDSAY